MIEEESAPAGITQSTQEAVAHLILSRFPLATLQTKQIGSGTLCEISFQGRIILKLDAKGARYLFPSRRKRMIKWDRITKSGLPRIIEFILQDLAQADYEVLSTRNKLILKRPIHISRYLRCPQCKTGGGMKLILRAESLTEENSEIYTPVSRSIEIDGSEIKCTLCGWMGIREQLLRKIRRPSNLKGHNQD